MQPLLLVNLSFVLFAGPLPPMHQKKKREEREREKKKRKERGDVAGGLWVYVGGDGIFF